MHKTILIAAALMITLSAAAQPGDQKKERLTVEQEAQIKVDGMAKELPRRTPSPFQWLSKHPMEAPKLPEVKLQ